MCREDDGAEQQDGGQVKAQPGPDQERRQWEQGDEVEDSGILHRTTSPLAEWFTFGRENLLLVTDHGAGPAHSYTHVAAPGRQPEQKRGLRR